MAEYYGYLLKTTWPSVSVLLILFLLVIGRLFWKGWRTWKSRRNFVGLALFIGKMVLWIIVLVVYSRIFFLDHPDWYYKPFVCEGLIEEKIYDQSNNQYKIKIARNSQGLILNVDQNLYSHLGVKDQVRLKYLPIRQEVIRCDILAYGVKTEK